MLTIHRLPAIDSSSGSTEDPKPKSSAVKPVRFNTEPNGAWLLMKGAAEQMIERSNYILTPLGERKPFTKKLKTKLLALNGEMCNKGTNLVKFLLLLFLQFLF